MMEQILLKIKNIVKNQKVLVACSTGVDSTVLLDLVLKAVKQNQVVVVHINHARRKASDDEEAYLREICEQKGIKLYVKKLNQRYDGNFQNWARKQRYQYFLEIASLEQVDIMMTAHHADDNLETILMRMIKGTSFKGYGGMEETTTFGNYILERPLLYVDKEQIIDYAKQEKLIFFEDASNQTDDYLRNRLRKYVIPVLKEENPALAKAVETYSQTIFDAHLIVQKEVNSFIKAACVVNNKMSKIQVNSFLELSSFMQVQVLFEILKPFKLSKALIEEIIKQIKAVKTKIVTKITTNLLMIKEYGNLIFTKPLVKEPFYLKIATDGIYQLPNGAIIEASKNICNFKAAKGYLCYNIQALPIIIRNRKDGDRINLPGGSKKVSDYLTDKKVPYLVREKVLLICDKDDLVLCLIEPLDEL